MRNWILRPTLAYAIVILISSVHAQTTNLPSWTSEVSNTGWKVREMGASLVSDKNRLEYETLLSQWKEQSLQLAEKLVQEDEWKSFSKLYQEMDSAGKQNFHYVVQGILARLSQAMGQGDVDHFLQAQEYFPGYGYAKPGYSYRKGEEVNREALYTYWRDEEIDEKTSESREMNIDVKLVQKIKIAIPELIEGVKFDIDIDGQMHKVVKVKFNKEVTIRTKQKRQVQVERVWFKLYEAKKKWWGEPEWNLVGKTFQHDSALTGEAVITEAEVVANSI
mgnify:CR=1 FL=1